MANHECKYDKVIPMIREDINEIKHDVKSLLAFKWQIVGGAGVVGAILSFIFGVLNR